MARRCAADFGMWKSATQCTNWAVPGSLNCKHHGGVTPPVLIGLPCSDSLRTSELIPSLMALRRPAGTGFKKAAGLGPAHPLNEIGAAFLAGPYQYLFLTNDDNLCPINAIYDLMDRDVDVVSGLYFGRLMPFEPILFDSVEVVEGERWYKRHLMQHGEQGIVSAAAVGDGCLLIKRKVLETIPYPWWEYGETKTDLCDHDVKFSRKVVEAGFGLYCDLDVKVDHIAQVIVRPWRSSYSDKWMVQLVQDEGRILEVPIASADMGVK